MHLGTDFWLIIKLIEFIIKVLKAWSEENNEDTEKGKV